MENPDLLYSRIAGASREEVLASSKPVVLFVDTFNGYFEPGNASSALKVLQAAGYTAYVASKTIADGKSLCCGRTFLASGMVDKARAKAGELVAALLPFVEKGIAIIGLEPSCLLTLRDEALVMSLGDAEQTVGRQALLLEEFLAREAAAGQLEAFKAQLKPVDRTILLHGHCHQKAFGAVSPIIDVLKLIPGAQPGVDLFSLSKVTVGDRALAWGCFGKPLISLNFLFTFFRRIVSTPTNGDTRCKAGKRSTLACESCHATSAPSSYSPSSPIAALSASSSTPAEATPTSWVWHCTSVSCA